MSSFRRVLRTLRSSILQAIPTAIIIVILNFILLQMAPGDVVDVLAAESGAATLEGMTEMRERFGLNAPVVEQLISYLGRLAHLDLGTSARFGVPVSELIAQRLPGTLLLMVLALSTAVLIGIVLGAIMSAFAGRLPDRVLSVLSLLFYSIPNFWIGLMLIVLFSVKLGWLPSGGSGSIGMGLTGWDLIVDKARYLVLPAASLALYYVAIYGRLTRAAMLEVRSQDYVRTARAKGLPPIVVTVHHILRNALIPITTMAGMHVGAMLGGAVVVETVFSLPGLGRLAFESVLGRDLQVLLGILLLSSFLVIIMNALIDLLHAFLDPKIGAH
ncbi:ABC transporter permease [Aureimonas fodinaquatilis]|uniref:ABC transporter permease n=1 Tax=Aureimonas fodinaquatilis TaxID=2565783 RepID=A0A5B0DYR2_9HYPH|nr:ABC transporter permease [Aureimonas fodinaquatilis]KAA0970985.1 ABC transporter permease [Aureimonas fodinaquatilis]